ncbi:UDP-N-acetylglucosamine diphosphorylase [Parachlamydia sp. AcF125]|uniref:acyltransferase n=1 Tax=Parachlamydia sp. AcF125 TaxID=2795736 RepID=UPI001BC9F9B3|nr:UDP-N-acetylglucosamine diphosphorylase [Parachlamydia sp. AcF125]MBS4167773.1 Bifunctional protein GlmU [Parachlamydia sp. AcF125]
MDFLSPSYFFDLTQYVHKGLFDSTDYVWTALDRLESYLEKISFQKQEAIISPSAHLVNPDKIHLGKGTIVEPGAYIQGPCWIGDRCKVRHGAYIRGFVVTGDDCVIGHDTEIIHSILFNHAHAAHFAYLGQSILGNHVNLGAGTKCANLKLDRQPVSVVVEGQSYKTGLRKLGAIVGDSSQIGCNVVLNPGTLLGKNVLCYPTLNCGGFVPSYHIVKSRKQLMTIPIQRGKHG